MNTLCSIKSQLPLGLYIIGYATYTVGDYDPEILEKAVCSNRYQMPLVFYIMGDTIYIVDDQTPFPFKGSSCQHSSKYAYDYFLS